MACDIQILSVTGTSLPQQTKANTVTVGGSAQDCSQLNVAISCGGNSTSKLVNVGSNGNWAVIFDTSTLGCTCGESIIASAGCVDDPQCFEERGFDLHCESCPYVDDINFIVQLDPYPTPLCVNGKTRTSVTLTAMGSPGAGKYEWEFGDNSSGTTTGPSVSHDYEFPDSVYNVKVTYFPAQSGCPQTSKVKTLFVPDCADVPPPPPPKRPGGIIDHTDVDHRERPEGIIDHTDVGPKKKVNGGGGRLSCDALLVAAIGLLLVGGLGIAIAVCAKVLLAGAVAGAVAALGVALFGVWLAICGKITSCDVMRKMYSLLRLIVLFGVPIGLLAGAVQAGGGIKLDGWCWVALLGYYGSIAWLKDRLETVMVAAGCPPTATF